MHRDMHRGIHRGMHRDDMTKNGRGWGGWDMHRTSSREPTTRSVRPGTYILPSLFSLTASFSASVPAGRSMSRMVSL
jgi:hypothetical protein